MATCPNCGRFNGPRHRCRGVWRLRLAIYARITLAAAMTAVAGGLVSQVLYGATSAPTVALTGVAGGVVMWSFLRGEPAATRGAALRSSTRAPR